MPFSSMALMREASVYRAGGWVKCWLPGQSSVSVSRLALLPGRAGRDGLLLLSSSLPSSYTAVIAGELQAAERLARKL